MGKCMYCGRQIKENKGPVQKIYCSDACRRKWNKENSVEEPKKRFKFYCRWCSKEFETERDSDLFCSSTCKKKDKESRKHDALSRDAIEARKLGITYGEYQARKYWEIEGPKMRVRMQAFKDRVAEEKRKKDDNDK